MPNPTLKALPPEKFDYWKAHHLLNRAGFGGTWVSDWFGAPYPFIFQPDVCPHYSKSVQDSRPGGVNSNAGHPYLGLRVKGREYHPERRRRDVSRNPEGK